MILGTWKATDAGNATVVWGNSDNVVSGTATAPRWMKALELDGINGKGGETENGSVK